MFYENILRIIEIILQIIVVLIAWKALSVWKSEMRGQDKYKLARDLLEYIKNLRFVVYGKNGSLHQIYLNDILLKTKGFYSNHLRLTANEKTYFDSSIFHLFEHIDVRSDIFIPKQIRSNLEELSFITAELIDRDKSKHTYIHLDSIKFKKNDNLNDGIYVLSQFRNIKIGEYFKKWEKLAIELRKIVYEK